MNNNNNNEFYQIIIFLHIQRDIKERHVFLFLFLLFTSFLSLFFPPFYEYSTVTLKKVTRNKKDEKKGKY